MLRFFPLKVQAIERNTKQSVVVALEVPTELQDTFRYRSGQYLTFRHTHQGEELRRSYSICVGEGNEVLKVGIKKVNGGAFSSYANDDLKVGEFLDVMPPIGQFRLSTPKNRLLMIAAGSGITPILSHMETVFAGDPYADVTLIYGNKNTGTVMFRERIEELKNEHLGRFSVMHVLSSSPQDIELFSGRITQEKCKKILTQWVRRTEFDQALICGPEDMILGVRLGLVEMGIPVDKITFELFTTAKRQTVPPKIGNAAVHDTKLTVVLDGTSHQLTMNRNERVLAAARQASLDVPFSCESGICSTCRCKILEGQGDMAVNHALEDYEITQGYALSCQLVPSTEKIVVSYDEGH